MTFTPAGTNISSRVTFNSGTIDFGNERIVQLDNVSLAIEWTIADLFVLGSIKPADKVRHSQKVTMSGKIKSYPAEIEQIALGSSSVGNPMTANTLDGQPTLQNPVFTGFDRNNKQFQYQLTGALFKSTKMSARQEDYSEWDFELEALDVTELFTA